jgi:transcription initiation factor TFIIH subunit 2
MVRYLYVVVDGSRWMRQKDPALPGGGTRLDVAVQLLRNFVGEYYDQNPLSQLGFVLCRRGEAEILSRLSGSSRAHRAALTSLAEAAAAEGPAARGGEFSLQNGLEVAGRSLGHQPRHGSREVVVLTAALSTCDPGHLLAETLPKLRQASIRVSCFALCAEMHVCRRLAEETGGTMGVCLDKDHFRSWLSGQSVPPPAAAKEGGAASAQTAMTCDMILMGFPARVTLETAGLVHATREKTVVSRTSYVCPQCQANNAELPTDCAVCGLKLVLASHLARSFHHCFPCHPFMKSWMRRDTPSVRWVLPVKLLPAARQPAAVFRSTVVVAI